MSWNILLSISALNVTPNCRNERWANCVPGACPRFGTLVGGLGTSQNNAHRALKSKVVYIMKMVKAHQKVTFVSRDACAPKKDSPLLSSIPDDEPEETCYSLRRSRSGWVLVTRLVRGDRVLADDTNEPDILAAQLGRLSMAISRLS